MTREEAIREACKYMERFIDEHVLRCSCGEWFFALDLRFEYCSKQCAHEANKRSKRRWWYDNIAKSA